MIRGEISGVSSLTVDGIKPPEYASEKQKYKPLDFERFDDNIPGNTD